MYRLVTVKGIHLIVYLGLSSRPVAFHSEIHRPCAVLVEVRRVQQVRVGILGVDSYVYRVEVREGLSSPRNTWSVGLEVQLLHGVS